MCMDNCHPWNLSYSNYNVCLKEWSVRCWHKFEFYGLCKFILIPLWFPFCWCTEQSVVSCKSSSLCVMIMEISLHFCTMFNIVLGYWSYTSPYLDCLVYGLFWVILIFMHLLYSVRIDGIMIRIFPCTKDPLPHLNRAERCVFLHGKGFIFSLRNCLYPLVFLILGALFSLSLLLAVCAEFQDDLPQEVLHLYMDYPPVFCTLFPFQGFIPQGFTWRGFLMRHTWWIICTMVSHVFAF